MPTIYMRCGNIYKKDMLYNVEMVGNNRKQTLHDSKYCSCMAVGIDGGISAGNRILVNLSDIEIEYVFCNC